MSRQSPGTNRRKPPRPVASRRTATTKRPRGNRTKAAAVQRQARRQGQWALAAKAAMTLVTIPVLAVALIFVHDQAVGAAVFRLSTIEVTGLQRLNRQSVLDQGGLRLGRSALAVNLTRVRHRLLAHPWIRDASVDRRLPDAIWVDVTEQVPVARAVLAHHRLIVTDRGDLFRDPGTVTAGPLPELTGLDYMDIDPDSRLEPAIGNALRTILDHQAALAARFGWGAIKRIHVDRDLGLTVYPSQRVRAVRIGFGHFDAKWRRLDVLFAQWRRIAPTDAALKAIDVSGEQRGIIQLAQVAPASAAEKENNHADQ